MRLFAHLKEKLWSIRKIAVSLCHQTSNYKWIMTYLNQFHKEASERKMRKIAESKQLPMNSVDAANYMKRNVEIASHM